MLVIQNILPTKAQGTKMKSLTQLSQNKYRISFCSNANSVSKLLGGSKHQRINYNQQEEENLSIFREMSDEVLEPPTLHDTVKGHGPTSVVVMG